MTQLPSSHHITYQLQYRKCGKPSCRRCHSEQGHGPYWYAYWSEGGRLRCAYMGKVHPSTPEPSQDRSAAEKTLETVAGLNGEERSSKPDEPSVSEPLLQADLPFHGAFTTIERREPLLEPCSQTMNHQCS
jgi:hypothetical protein